VGRKIVENLNAHVMSSYVVFYLVMLSDLDYVTLMVDE